MAKRDIDPDLEPYPYWEAVIVLLVLFILPGLLEAYFK
jgi:hypothetical protein